MPWPLAVQAQPPSVPDNRRYFHHQVAVRQQALAQEAKELAYEQHALVILRQKKEQQLESLGSAPVPPAVLEKAQLDVEAVHVRLDSLTIRQKETEAALARIQEQIRQFNTELHPPPGASSDAVPPEPQRQEQETLARQLAHQQQMLALATQHLTNLQRLQELAAEKLALTQKWVRDLETHQVSAVEASRHKALAEMTTRIAEEQTALQERVNALRTEIEKTRKAGAEGNSLGMLKLRIQVLEGRYQLKQDELSLAQARFALDQLAVSDKDPELPLTELRRLVERAQNIITRLDGNLPLLKQQQALLKEQQQLAHKETALQSRGRQRPRG
ncbi:MAG: hypothetical protein AB7G75_02590 [Candidatus Binatia bacterium]